MRSLLTLAFVFAVNVLLSQGIIRGKITDGVTGETLIGANVIIQNSTRGVMADLDGNYSIEGLTPGSYDVIGSFIGYTPQTLTLVIEGDEVVLQSFNLFQETFVIEQAAEVIAKIDRSRDVYMENIKKKNASSLDYISSQQLDEREILMQRPPCSASREFRPWAILFSFGDCQTATSRPH